MSRVLQIIKVKHWMSKVSLKLVAANLTLRLSTESALSDKAITGNFPSHFDVPIVIWSCLLNAPEKVNVSHCNDDTKSQFV